MVTFGTGTYTSKVGSARYNLYFTWKATFPGDVLSENLMLMASRMLQVKKGTQHTRKQAGTNTMRLQINLTTIPNTIPKVFVAFFSFLCGSLVLFFFFFLLDLTGFSFRFCSGFNSKPSCVETPLSNLSVWNGRVD